MNRYSALITCLCAIGIAQGAPKAEAGEMQTYISGSHAEKMKVCNEYGTDCRRVTVVTVPSLNVAGNAWPMYKNQRGYNESAARRPNGRFISRAALKQREIIKRR